MSQASGFRDPGAAGAFGSSGRVLRRHPDRGTLLELLVLPLVAVSLFGVLTPNGMPSSGDPYVYFDRAVSVLQGLIPFKDFPSEYPLLSLIPMTLPHLWPDVDHSGYFTLLNIENGVLATAVALTLLALTRLSWSLNSNARTLGLWALLIVVMAPILAWRFDLAAVVLTMLGVVAAARERPGWAGVLLGLAALTKIYPLAVVPILAARCLANRDRRGAVRMVAACIITGLVVMVPLLAVAGRDALSFVDYQFARGLQVESGGGGLVLLAHTFSLADASIGFSHYSFESDSSLSKPIVSALTPLTIGLFVVIFGACFRRLRAERVQLGEAQSETVVAYLAATLLVLLLTNKVFSPQYLVWMLPFGALFRRPQAYLLLVICVLTILVFPLNYQALLKMQPLLVLILNARNLLLALLAVWLLAGHFSTRRLRLALDDRGVRFGDRPGGSTVLPA